MKVLRFILTVSCWSVAAWTMCLNAQNWVFYKKNDGLNCRFFATDPLNNLYIATTKNEILKYDNQGRFESRYANKKYGTLSLIKAINPFKILTYYADYQVIIIMDAMVNPIATIALNDLGIGQVGAVTMSDDGFIWVVDNATKQLIKISFNQNGARIEQQTQMFFPDLDISDVVCRDNVVYLNTHNKGLLVFDRFGQFNKSMGLKDITQFHVIGSYLFYQQNKNWFIFDLTSLQERPLALPPDVLGTEPMCIEKGRLFVLKEAIINIYDEQ